MNLGRNSLVEFHVSLHTLYFFVKIERISFPSKNNFNRLREKRKKSEQNSTSSRLLFNFYIYTKWLEHESKTISALNVVSSQGKTLFLFSTIWIFMLNVVFSSSRFSLNNAKEWNEREIENLRFFFSSVLCCVFEAVLRGTRIKIVCVKKRKWSFLRIFFLSKKFWNEHYETLRRLISITWKFMKIIVKFPINKTNMISTRFSICVMTILHQKNMFENCVSDDGKFREKSWKFSLKINISSTPRNLQIAC